MKRIKMWHPPMAPTPEPFCELRYGDVVFEIPYTLVHYMTGWLVCGMKGSCVPVDKAYGDVRQAFDYLERAMSYDSATWTEEQKAFYKKHGIPIRKPELNWEE